MRWVTTRDPTSSNCTLTAPPICRCAARTPTGAINLMVDFPLALLTRKQFLLSELQTRGLRLLDSSAGASSRRGGAGPTDHKAVTVLGTTIMVPVHTHGAANSTYVATPPDRRGVSILQNEDAVVCEISFP